MGWSCIGNSSTANDVAKKLNDLSIGNSVTISINAARDSFVVWVDAGGQRTPSKIWKAFPIEGSQEKIAEIMNQNNLAPDCAVVSVDANSKWQLWGYLQV